jgi:hypothetical protein
MDLFSCPWLSTNHNQSEYLTIDYDCLVHHHHHTDTQDINRNQTKFDNNLVHFSAQIRIESPPDDFINDTLTIDPEDQWRDHLLKTYIRDQQMKSIVIQDSRISFNDILRTIAILIVFAFVMILLMLVVLAIYRRVTWMRKNKATLSSIDDRQQQQPFPADIAYDNLKGNSRQSITDSGTTTDV